MDSAIFPRLNASFFASLSEQAGNNYQLTGPCTDLTGMAWHHDSRNCAENTVFIALAGSVADGHDFIVDAYARGTRVFCIAQERYQEILEKLNHNCAITYILCHDTGAALLHFAQSWRLLQTSRFIGVTGSVGKTTTKTLIGHIAAHAGWRIYVSRGNQNTLVGCCLNLLSMDGRQQCAVFELGISMPGEMERMVDVVRPDNAIITMIGHSHVQGLGDRAAIAAEKRKIFAFLKPDAIGIINGDVPLLKNTTYAHPVLSYGFKNVNTIQGSRVKTVEQGTQLYMTWNTPDKERYTLFVPSFSKAYITNALAAAAVCHVLGIDHKIIVSALAQECVVPARFQALRLSVSGGILIHDAYNASPESMKVALTALQKMPTYNHKTVILGDMLELGPQEQVWHKRIVRLLANTVDIGRMVLVGKRMRQAAEALLSPGQAILFDDWQEAYAYLQKNPIMKNEIALIKGSLGTQLYRIPELLMKETV